MPRNNRVVRRDLSKKNTKGYRMPMPQMQEQLLISPNNDGLRRVQTAGGSNMGTGLRGTKERTLAGRAQRPNLQPYTGSQAKQYMHARSFKKPPK